MLYQISNIKSISNIKYKNFVSIGSCKTNLNETRAQSSEFTILKLSELASNKKNFNQKKSVQFFSRKEKTDRNVQNRSELKKLKNQSNNSGSTKNLTCSIFIWQKSTLA